MLGAEGRRRAGIQGGYLRHGRRLGGQVRLFEALLRGGLSAQDAGGFKYTDKEGFGEMSFSTLWNKFKKRYISFRTHLVNSYCYYFYYHAKIDDNLVFVMSRDGKDFTGNMFYIVKELSKPEYNNLSIIVYAHRDMHARINQLSKNYNLKKFKLVSKEYRAVSVMEKAKYILSDTSLPWKYVKREGQIIISTWHGTPFKVMGRRIEAEKHALGTVQHIFISSDYIIYPSEYMRDTMLRDYMAENVIQGKILMAGYPRNSIFFNTDRRNALKNQLGYTHKTLFAYMPTHRGSMGQDKNEQQLSDVLKYLRQLDIKMDDNQLLFVKLHLFNQQKIDFTTYSHIVPFPDGYETYDILNITDCLITDYSSVFFDYSNSRKKVILFTYDKDEYFLDRGTYFPLSDLPFPCVDTVEALYQEMCLPKLYDDTQLVNKFCTFDSLNATNTICRHIFKKEVVCKEEIVGNQRENVLIFGGSLKKNGITTSLISLLSSLDLEQRNYYIAFKRWEVNSEPARIDVIPQNVNYLPLMSDQAYTLRERYIYNKYCQQENSDIPYPPLLKRLFRRELDRYYWGTPFSHIIQFDGYGKNITLLFLEANTKKTIFVHNDMIQELRSKNNQHLPTLKRAYLEYDNVAVVSEDLIYPTSQISGNSLNIKVVNNVHNYIDIQKRSLQQIEFQSSTEIKSYVPGGIAGVFKRPGYKFISIGRFSTEKGHIRLIDAFDKFIQLYPDTQLIIVGGYGDQYQQTIKYVESKKSRNNITIIKQIDNPMPILAKCDLFILSSFYEGLGLVILEADCLGVPSFSTDIVGPRGFMTKYKGYLVENSELGILNGMYDFVKGSISTLVIDYAKYNHQALQEFLELF